MMLAAAAISFLFTVILVDTCRVHSHLFANKKWPLNRWPNKNFNLCEVSCVWKPSSAPERLGEVFQMVVNKG